MLVTRYYSVRGLSAGGKCASHQLSTLAASQVLGEWLGQGSWPRWSWVGVGSSALSLCNAEVVGVKFGLVEPASLTFFSVPAC